MSDDDFDLGKLKKRMDGALKVLKDEFAGLRTGRASASLLDPVMVNAYGSMVPLNQVGNVTVPEPRMISVQVWDKGQLSAVEKAIREADLGLNPITDGQNLRIPLPELNEERRAELAKVAGKYAEQARISVRNVRRDGMEQLKKAEKDKLISKDELHDRGEEVQKATDAVIKEIDAALATKEKEIMQV